MAETMRGAVWYGKNDVRIENLPLPSAPKPGWVQIKVAYCGICGSSLYEGDAYYEIDNMDICPDCLKEEYRRVV